MINIMLCQPPAVLDGEVSQKTRSLCPLCPRPHLQGILDMLVLSQAPGRNDLIIHALKNNFEADAYFVKVMGK